MDEVVVGAARRTDRHGSRTRLLPARCASSPPWHRVALVLWLAAGFALPAADASALTLRLAFPDGQPMTYGSACSGAGCLLRGDGLETDGHGEVRLAAAPDAIVEYRRDGIDLSVVPAGVAAGQAHTAGERTTVVLPRMLQGSAPAVDAIEAEIVTRINQARGAQGLAPAQLIARLSRAADLQATWLSSNGVGLLLPLLSHIGPFGSTISFRLGEVSFPEPVSGAEIAAAGTTPAEALSMWLSSSPHRDVVLAPGALLIGVAQVGSVILVETHVPCAGCAPPASAAALEGASASPTGSSGAGGPGAQRTPATPGTEGDAARRAAACGAEQLRVRRLRTRHGRQRVRVTVGCLRPGAGYTLAVLQRPSRKRLAQRTIAGAGTITLALRPARSARALRIKLKRNGRAVATRTIATRPAERR